MSWEKKSETEQAVTIVVSIVVSILVLIAVLMTVMPVYHVWSQRKEGEALLAHAQSAKEVAVAEARAKMESAVLLANAEVSRAEGVAKANKIIADSLKGNEVYLRYLWIQDVAGKDVNKTVVYIPTETNLPILEANRLREANGK